LKEQATKWEVDVARLNADLASKLSNPLTFILPDTSCPTYHNFFWYNNHADTCSYFQYLLCLAGLFPASVEDVEKALQVDRLSQNVPVDSPNWDMSEQLIAQDARKNAMMAYTNNLFLGTQEAHQALWLGQTTPTDPVDLGNDLQLSKVRVREWRDSGA
jgi:hypothetical protein